MLGEGNCIKGKGKRNVFKFFRDRWVSRKEFIEVERDYQREFNRRHEIAVAFHKERKKLLSIIEEKEKAIQRLKLEVLELKK